MSITDNDLEAEAWFRSQRDQWTKEREVARQAYRCVSWLYSEFKVYAYAIAPTLAHPDIRVVINETCLEFEPLESEYDPAPFVVRESSVAKVARATEFGSMSREMATKLLNPYMPTDFEPMPRWWVSREFAEVTACWLLGDGEVKRLVWSFK